MGFVLFVIIKIAGVDFKMKCKKCGAKLMEGYLGMENRVNKMCSKCLMEAEVKMKRPSKNDILMWG